MTQHLDRAQHSDYTGNNLIAANLCSCEGSYTFKVVQLVVVDLNWSQLQTGVSHLDSTQK